MSPSTPNSVVNIRESKGHPIRLKVTLLNLPKLQILKLFFSILLLLLQENRPLPYLILHTQKKPLPLVGVGGQPYQLFL